MREDQIQRTLMNDNSKDSENKVVKSNRFPRADEEDQSIKKLFDLNVRRSRKKTVFNEYSEYVKRSCVKNQIFWSMRFIFNALV